MTVRASGGWTKNKKYWISVYDTVIQPTEEQSVWDMPSGKQSVAKIAI